MNFNPTKFAAVIAAAKAKAANSPRWIRAIDRAAATLLAGELIVTTLVNGAIVTSPRGTYHANGNCDCAAAKHGDSVCYHRAAARLVELYEAAMMAPTTSGVLPGKKELKKAQDVVVRAPRITRSVERDHTGARYPVTYCDGWHI